MISDPDLIEFLMMCLFLNMFGYIIETISTKLKIQSLSKEDFVTYMQFATARQKYLVKNISYLDLIINRLTWLIPGHELILSIVGCYNRMKHDGAEGLIRAIAQRESICAYPLLDYTLVR